MTSFGGVSVLKLIMFATSNADMLCLLSSGSSVPPPQPISAIFKFGVPASMKAVCPPSKPPKEVGVFPFCPWALAPLAASMPPLKSSSMPVEGDHMLVDKLSGSKYEGQFKARKKKHRSISHYVVM